MNSSSNPRRVFLVGPMGSGKTTVGRQLARLLNMKFLDLDLELEKRCGVEVSVIFEIEGEDGFRQRETAMLDELTRHDNIVLGTGGGSVIREENRRMLSERGLVVYLETGIGQQLARLAKDKQRPLLQTPDRRQRLAGLAKQRNPLYDGIADITVPSENISPAAMAKRVANIILAFAKKETSQPRQSVRSTPAAAATRFTPGKVFSRCRAYGSAI